MSLPEDALLPDLWLDKMVYRGNIRSRYQWATQSTNCSCLFMETREYTGGGSRNKREKDEVGAAWRNSEF